MAPLFWTYRNQLNLKRESILAEFIFPHHQAWTLFFKKFGELQYFGMSKVFSFFFPQIEAITLSDLTYSWRGMSMKNFSLVWEEELCSPQKEKVRKVSWGEKEL